jgi:hypothetical protein
MICHIPRLHDTPPGKWSCCECKASLFTRKQRCGECMECLRPNCGECAACKGKKQFGGDGRYGSACKFRKCKFMRYAPPESISKSPSLKSNSESVGPKTKYLPGVGWKARRVFESGQYVCHWISPTRQIEFKRHLAACNFERLRIKFGSDEVKAWEKYRAQCTRKGNVTRVVSPQDYDAKSKSGSTASRARQYSGGALLSTPRKKLPDVLQLKDEDDHTFQNAEAKNDISKSPSLGTNSLGPTKNPPGLGWKLKPVCESGYVKTYWISPVRQIEFRRHKEACNFERLRIQFGSDEVEAWEEYRRRTTRKGIRTRVVSPQNHDAQSKSVLTRASRARRLSERTISSKPRKISSDGQQLRRKEDNLIPRHNAAKNDISKSPSLGTNSLGPKKNPPGPGWESSLVHESSQVVTHWISPVRRIEFKRHTAACKFEKLRNEFGSDEVKAWEEFRKRYYTVDRKSHPSFVVSPQNHDAHPKGGVVHKAGLNKKRQRSRDHAVCLAPVSRKRPRRSTTNNCRATSKCNRGVTLANDKERESFESDDFCYSCDDGGGKLEVSHHTSSLPLIAHCCCASTILDLVLCDFCPKAFHLECHIPKLHVIPQGEWRCCECSAGLFKRKQRCGCCDACLRSDACGECAACKTKQRFGGTLKRGGKQCELRQCRDKRYAAPETLPTCNVSRSPNTSGTSICNKGRATTKRKGQRRPVPKSIVKFSGGQHHESRFIASPFQSYSQLGPDRGLNSGEIKMICLRPAKNMSFFRQCFSKRILRIEKSLRDVPPEKFVTEVSHEMMTLPTLPTSLLLSV